MRVDIDNPERNLVNAEVLLETLWKDERSRPSLRSLHRLRQRRLIPFLKVGHRVFFDPVDVRRALDANFTVKNR